MSVTLNKIEVEDRDEDVYEIKLADVGVLYTLNIAHETNSEGDPEIQLELVAADGEVLDHDVLFPSVSSALAAQLA